MFRVQGLGLYGIFTRMVKVTVRSWCILRMLILSLIARPIITGEALQRITAGYRPSRELLRNSCWTSGSKPRRRSFNRPCFAMTMEAKNLRSPVVYPDSKANIARSRTSMERQSAARNARGASETQDRSLALGMARCGWRAGKCFASHAKGGRALARCLRQEPGTFCNKKSGRHRSWP